MTATDLRYLFDYSYWARDRILRAAANATDAELNEDVGLPSGSIFGTLVHTLSAEHVWRLRCAEGISPPSLFDPTTFTNLDAIVDRWRGEQQQLGDFLQGLSDADCAQTIDYRTTSGKAQSQVLWRILAHVVNHGTQHRSECAHALTGFGHSPGDLDLILFEREQKKA